MSALDRIKETITEALMNSRGWDEISKEQTPLEWDPNQNDSQYSLIKEDVDFVVDEFVEQLAGLEQDELEEEYVFDDEEDEEVEEPQSLFDEYGHLRRDKTNTTSASIFIFMDAGTGNPRYVSDVREWLAAVDRLGVPNNTEIEGTLHLSFDIDEPFVERLECGGCGSKDVLLTVHSCEETPC
jgi:hypothetical protein